MGMGMGETMVMVVMDNGPEDQESRACLVVGAPGLKVILQFFLTAIGFLVLSLSDPKRSTKLSLTTTMATATSHSGDEFCSRSVGRGRVCIVSLESRQISRDICCWSSDLGHLEPHPPICSSNTHSRRTMKAHGGRGRGGRERERGKKDKVGDAHKETGPGCCCDDGN